MPRARAIGRKSVSPHDITAVVYPHYNGGNSSREINRSKSAVLASHIAVHPAVETHVTADDIAGSIDIEGPREDSVRVINGGEAETLELICRSPRVGANSKGDQKQDSGPESVSCFHFSTLL